MVFPEETSIWTGRLSEEAHPRSYDQHHPNRWVTIWNKKVEEGEGALLLKQRCISSFDLGHQCF